jgi:hypothetical protein
MTNDPLNGPFLVSTLNLLQGPRTVRVPILSLTESRLTLQGTLRRITYWRSELNVLLRQQLAGTWQGGETLIFSPEGILESAVNGRRQTMVYRIVGNTVEFTRVLENGGIGEPVVMTIVSVTPQQLAIEINGKRAGYVRQP